MKPALALITFLAILALCLRLVAATATVDERAPATLATMQRFPSSRYVLSPCLLLRSELLTNNPLASKLHPMCVQKRLRWATLAIFPDRPADDPRSTAAPLCCPTLPRLTLSPLHLAESHPPSSSPQASKAGRTLHSRLGCAAIFP